MAITCLISIAWLMVGYSLVFAPGDPKHNNEIVGGAEKMWFWGYKGT